MREDDKELTAPDWDGERYIPGMHPQIELEHRHRYFLAARFVSGKRVLDVASGEGYGSAILARQAAQVTGLDIDNAAVGAAQQRYRDVLNVSYCCGSAAAIPFPDASFDVVTSFETIEHHDQHEAMISEIRRVLTPQGLLIISSPNKLEYSDIPGYSNPHHVKELYLDEFRNLLKSKFAHLALYGQRVATGSIVMPVDDLSSGGSSEHLVEANNELKRAREFLHPLYFIALASSAALPDFGSSYYENDLAVARFDLARTLVETKAYARYGAEPYGENITSVQYSPLQTQHRELVFSFPARADKSLSGIRLDFSDSPALLNIDSICLVADGSNIWSTTFVPASFSESFALLSTPDDSGAFNALVTDPEGWAELAIPDHVLVGVGGAFEVRVRLSICALVEGAALSEAFTRRLFEQMLLAGELRAANTEIRSQLQHVRKLEARIQGLSLELKSAHDHVALIHRSLSWKVTRPMRVVKRLLRPESMSRREQFVMLRTALQRRLGLVSSDAPVVPKNESAPPQPAHGAADRGEADAGLASENVVDQSPIDLLEPEPTDGFVTADWVAEDYVADVPVAPHQSGARLLAFYLPQFHPIPENDAWWGKGFTEWTNVTRARPQFVGHYQPHLPGELGFYDLRVADVLARQVELARSAGIYGFCFYFYWFGGKRLLELPLLQYLGRNDLTMPFCLCWANENWTRRWDGQNNHVLIEQQHSEADDIQFISYLSQYLKDPRYIRVAGKPLVIVYRPSLLPDPVATSSRWRKWARENGIGEIHLAYTQSFEKADPASYGFDAAIEFPPNNTQVPDYRGQVRWTNEKFGGVLRDWRQLVARSQAYEAPDYRLYRGVTPSWDNEARRPGRGTVLVGSSPALFSEWVENVVADTIQTTSDVSDRLVFVNAWNEWAEGAHLEPDRRYGYAWLHATRQGLLNGIEGSPNKLVMVVHDAHPHGAQYLALHLLGTLTRQFHFSVAVVLLGAGVLKEKFEELAPVHDFSHPELETKSARELLIGRLFSSGYRRVLLNTVVSAAVLPLFKQRGFHSVVLVHEMAGVIRQHKLMTQVELASLHADKIVFPADIVRQSFSSFGNPLDPQKVVIRPQGLYKPNPLRSRRDSARSAIRARHGIANDTAIVLGAGFADRRKGIDLFIEIGRRVLEARHQKVAFMWIGHWPVAVEAEMKASIEQAGLTASFIFPGRVDDTELYFAACDLFALTSREDPFPSVVLEAMDAGLPVVAFSGVTGLEEVVRRSGGRLAAQDDIAQFAGFINDFLDQPELAAQTSSRAQQLIQSEFSFRHYVFDLLDLLEAAQRRVSVVIPNYNYARYIEERIRTVASQTYPIFELIVLDDCSSDGSLDVMRRVIAELDVDCVLVENQENSGSVFAQWVKGAALARGDYVWIAEADDLSLETFLAEVLTPFSDPAVVLSYCQSQQIEEMGKVLSANYHDYVADISPTKWSVNYIEDGADEVKEALAIKNTIPNVSAVVFQKRALLVSLEKNEEQLASLKVAGDWLVYLGVLDSGKVAFSKQALNLHRRHQSSVTLGSFDVRQLREIRYLQSIAAARWQVSRDVENAAHAYLLRLCHQFGVSEDEVTRQPS